MSATFYSKSMKNEPANLEQFTPLLLRDFCANFAPDFGGNPNRGMLHFWGNGQEPFHIIARRASLRALRALGPLAILFPIDVQYTPLMCASLTVD